MRPPIIENPRGQGLPRRVIQGALTLLFWGAWFYLMLPLITPLISLAEMELALLSSDDSRSHFRYTSSVLLFTGIIMLVMEMWVIYNVLLHRRKRGQRSLDKVSPGTLARHFGVSPTDLADWHRSGQVTIRLTDLGRVCDVEINRKHPARRPGWAGTPRPAREKPLQTRLQRHCNPQPAMGYNSDACHKDACNRERNRHVQTDDHPVSHQAVRHRHTARHAERLRDQQHPHL